MLRLFFKNKKGTMLTEALISIFILGTIFVSITTAVTVSVTNTKRLQEINETSAYAQKVADAIYSIAKSDSETFFSKIEGTYTALHDSADAATLYSETGIPLDIYSIAGEARFINKDAMTLYNILTFSGEQMIGGMADEERSQYAVSLYVLPSDRASEPHALPSKNYFITYNPAMTASDLQGGFFGVNMLNSIQYARKVYSFKLVVSKTTTTIYNATTDFTKASPASVTYFFQIASNGS